MWPLQPAERLVPCRGRGLCCRPGDGSESNPQQLSWALPQLLAWLQLLVGQCNDVKDVGLVNAHRLVLGSAKPAFGVLVVSIAESAVPSRSQGNSRSERVASRTSPIQEPSPSECDRTRYQGPAPYQRSCTHCNQDLPRHGDTVAARLRPSPGKSYVPAG